MWLPQFYLHLAEHNQTAWALSSHFIATKLSLFIYSPTPPPWRAFLVKPQISKLPQGTCSNIWPKKKKKRVVALWCVAEFIRLALWSGTDCQASFHCTFIVHAQWAIPVLDPRRYLDPWAKNWVGEGIKGKQQHLLSQKLRIIDCYFFYMQRMKIYLWLFSLWNA